MACVPWRDWQPTAGQIALVEGDSAGSSGTYAYVLSLRVVVRDMLARHHTTGDEAEHSWLGRRRLRTALATSFCGPTASGVCVAYVLCIQVSLRPGHVGLVHVPVSTI